MTMPWELVGRWRLVAVEAAAKMLPLLESFQEMPPFPDSDSIYAATRNRWLDVCVKAFELKHAILRAIGNT